MQTATWTGAILAVMGTIKTRATDEDVMGFLASVPDERRRKDGLALLALMQDVTGAPATM